MIRDCLGPVPPERRPSLALPPRSCDCHVHVFGPYARYPLAADRSYTMPECPVEALFAMWRSIGVERGVIVNPSACGFDNRVTLDALKAFPGRLRGVAVITPEISDKALDEMTEAGMRGLRLNLYRRDGQPVYRGGVGIEALESLAPRVAERGWHLQLWLEAGDLIELAPRLALLPMPVVIDHMGRISTRVGTDYPGFRRLCALLEGGQVWTKISGADRLTVTGAPYRDVDAFARAVIAANPDRVVWGSDWPHVNYAEGPMPIDAELVELLGRWIPDEATRRKILVDNPERLYWT